MAGRVRVELPRGSEAPGLARRLVRDRLSSELSPVALAETQLVVSELVSNAVRHGVGTILLVVDVDDGTVRGEVVDEGQGFEVDVRERGLDEVSGRGLWLVASVAQRWGIHDGSSHVWFELALLRADEATTPPELGEDSRPEELG